MIPVEVTTAAEESGHPVEYLHGVWKAAIASGLDPAATLRDVLDLANSVDFAGRREAEHG